MNGQPYTVTYGPWAPDLADVAVEMQYQYGATPVPCADCLNVYYADGSYKSLPTPLLSTRGPANNPNSAFTAVDSFGNIVPFAGTSTQALRQVDGTWSATINVSGVGPWSFTQFGPYVYAVVQTAPLPGPASYSKLYQMVITGPSSVVAASGAPGGSVIATVGQFIMIGNQLQVVTGTIGTGDGSTKVFTGSIPGAVQPGTALAGDLNNSAITTLDDSNGNFSVSGMTGSIDYATGDISLTFTTAPANTHDVGYSAVQHNPCRVWWSPIGNPGGTWPAPFTDDAIAVQSSYEDMDSTLGGVQFIAGYPLYALIFQRSGITSATYVGGDVVFDFATYEKKRGLVTPGAVVQVGTLVYFLSDSGFFVTDGAQAIPIGTAQDNSSGIDNWFWTNVNTAAISSITAAYDARLRCIVFAIPTGTNINPDTFLLYNPLASRWTRASIGVTGQLVIWTDTDGTTQRLALLQAEAYSLLTGPPAIGYLESCDIMFTDGMTRYTMGVRPNANCADIPTVMVGNRNTLEDVVLYSNPVAKDAFSGVAPVTTDGIYTRVRVSSGAAQSIHGATLFLQTGGEV